MFTGIIEWFKNPDNQQVVQTFMLASGLGVGFFITKGLAVLKSPILFIINQFYSSIQLTDSTWELRGSYFAFMKFIQGQKLYFSRTVTPTSDVNRSDAVNSRMVTPGSGWMVMLWENRLFLVHTFFDQREFGLNRYTNIYTFGSGKKIFNRMSEVAMDASKDKMAVYRLGEDGAWGLLMMAHKRPFETVITENGELEKIHQSFVDYNQREEEDISAGAIWKHVVMLYGPPGTGKSSIAKVIASKMNYDVYMVNTNRVNDDCFISAIGKIPPEGLLLMEDLDHNQRYHRRGGGADLEEKEEKKNKQTTSVGLSLDGLLNTLDGILTPHGLKVILSTNHIEKLDPAVTRPERINMSVMIDYIGRDGLMKFIDFRYPGHSYSVIGETKVQPSLVSQAWRLNRTDVDGFADYLNKSVGTTTLKKDVDNTRNVLMYKVKGSK